MVTMCDRGGFYASATSTTSRPLYFPQCGQTRCGSVGSWQCGHSYKPGVRMASCARRVEVLRLECRRFGLGIFSSHTTPAVKAGAEARVVFRCCSALQMFQGGPTVIRRFHLATAVAKIAIFAAHRANPLACFRADRVHGHG